MRVISKKRLKDYWQTHVNSETPLSAWFTHVDSSSCEWGCWGDLRKDYPSADRVGDCIVFDIGGNNYRLIVRVRYPVFVYVLKVMTHAEYDKNTWVKACGCMKPPPKAAKTTKAAKKKKKKKKKVTKAAKKKATKKRRQ